MGLRCIAQGLQQYLRFISLKNLTHVAKFNEAETGHGVFVQIVSVILFLFETFHNKSVKVREICIEEEARGKYIKLLGGLSRTEIICNTLHFFHFCQWGCHYFHSKKPIKNILSTYIFIIDHWDKNNWNIPQHSCWIPCLLREMDWLTVN